MRRLHLILTLMGLAGMGTAQTSEYADRPHHWAFGISAGDVLHHLFNSDPSQEEYAAFVLEYTGHRYGVHLGFRPDYNKSDTEHEGFVNTDVTDQVSIAGNLAVTRILFEDDRWVVRAGLQYEGGWSREDIIEDSGFDRITTRRLQWNSGLGPMVDVRVFVHSRISLGLASSLVYVQSRSELQQLFTNFPDFNTTKDIVKDESVEVHEPATIYLRYHF